MKIRNVVTNQYPKFICDQLRNRKVLGIWKSDNNKNPTRNPNNNNNNNNVRNRWEPVPRCYEIK